MQDIFSGHRITQQGLVIRGESTEIIVPFSELPRVARAITGALGSPDEPQGPSERQRGSTRSLHHIVKLG
jgi:hypothetical protein